MSLSLNLTKILGLVGRLDDSADDDNPREHFRALLKENVTEVGTLRDFINECLSNKGEQYNHSLQDLVNHLGTMLGFKVAFGRYRGVQGETGHDGLWDSPEEFHVVVEVKTSETYPIKTLDLVRYVDELITQRKIPDWGSALGLYIVGRPDPEVKQLENSIVAEKRASQLRIVSVESLLTLAEMKSTDRISHKDILSLLRPSSPTVDSVVETMEHLFAQTVAPQSPQTPSATSAQPATQAAESTAGTPSYWLTPVSGEEHASGSAEQVIKELVVDGGKYAFSDTTPNKEYLREGDWICFYASGTGVVAHAQVATKPVRNPRLFSEDYPWFFTLKNYQFYPDSPVVVDVDLRSKLDAFQKSNPKGAWGWFVVTTRALTKHDFETLTRRTE